jgi:hypothetical protein
MDGTGHQPGRYWFGAQSRFHFPSGEQRDEAAGLRLWDAHAARLYAACETESAQALLIERCLPGPLGPGLPEQDQVVAGLLRQLWAQPHASYPFRPLSCPQSCACGRFDRAACQTDRVGVVRCRVSA